MDLNLFFPLSILYRNLTVLVYMQYSVFVKHSHVQLWLNFQAKFQVQKWHRCILSRHSKILGGVLGWEVEKQYEGYHSPRQILWQRSWSFIVISMVTMIMPKIKKRDRFFCKFFSFFPQGEQSVSFEFCYPFSKPFSYIVLESYFTNIRLFGER